MTEMPKIMVWKPIALKNKICWNSGRLAQLRFIHSYLLKHPKCNTEIFRWIVTLGDIIEKELEGGK